MKEGKTVFTAVHSEDGTRHKFAFWRDPDQNHWMLLDDQDYVRVLEPTWRESVPRIKAILANFGMTADIS